MNDTMVNFMLYLSVPFVFLIAILFVYDLVKFIQLLINGPYLSKYTEPITVKCTDMVEVKITKSERLPSSQYTYRTTAWVMRPSFSGIYKGKNLTFCRKKDRQQPVAEIGNYYTIYVKPGSMDCHDYYEEQEKNNLRKKHRKRILLYNLAMILMALWVFATIYFCMQVWK